MNSTNDPRPQSLRTNMAFALNLADSLGVAVQGVTANEWDEVTLYAWATPAAALDEVADREGWPSEPWDGENFHGRRQVFDVEGRSVRIALIGDVAQVVEVSA